MKHSVFPVAAGAMLLCIAYSCNMFTTSLGSEILGLDFSRNLGNEYNNLSTDSLANKASEITVIQDKTASKALIESLGKKDQEEIKNLSVSTQENILKIAVSTVLPISTITGALQDRGITLTSTDIADDDVSSLIADITSAMPVVDTKVVSTILTTPETLAQADSETLILGSAAIIAQIVQAENPDSADAQTKVDAIKDSLSNISENATPQSIAEQLINDQVVSKNSEQSLQAAITAAMVLSGKGNSGIAIDGEPVNRENDLKDANIAGFNIGSLLGLDS